MIKNGVKPLIYRTCKMFWGLFEILGFKLHYVSVRIDQCLENIILNNLLKANKPDIFHVDHSTHVHFERGEGIIQSATQIYCYYIHA